MPEAREATGTDPDRMRGGEQGFMLFTFSQPMDAGLMQQVKITPGSKLRFEAWAHAWSNHSDDSQAEKYEQGDDPLGSDGAGFEPFFAFEGGLADMGSETELSNFTFWIGIDPSGGRDPLPRG